MRVGITDLVKSSKMSASLELPRTSKRGRNALRYCVACTGNVPETLRPQGQ